MASKLTVDDLPNLPGFKPNRVDRSGVKRQGFKMVHGVAMEPTPKPSAEAVASATMTAKAVALEQAASSQSLVLPPQGTNNTAQWLVNSGQVLQFDAYFNEEVHQSADEAQRVRKCTIYYYLEDDTIQVNECKSENSGMPQGNFVKRHQIPKGEEAEDGLYTLDDLVVGGSIVIYSREFFITDCNPSTLQYLQSMGRDAYPVEAPADPYTTLRADFMSRETGADQTVSRNQQKSPMKKFMEATLGNTVNNKGLEGFLKFERCVLRFDAVWDDRDQLHGDLRRYTLHFFVADNEMEVVEMQKPNSGRDPFPLLVKKMKLPKPGFAGVPDANGRSDEPEPGAYYCLEDLSIGGDVYVFGRRLFITDADPATRRFYSAKGMDLGEAIAVPDETPALPERQVPPYNGWGSEADSYASTLSLVPKAPRTQFDLMGANLNRHVLRFAAKLVTDVPDDKGRKFVISFFCADDTIQISEPPQRNSGIVGGNFLYRSSVKNPATGKPFKSNDFHVGAQINVSSRIFQIDDVDEFTLKYMEGRPDAFPLSSAPKILADLRKKLFAEAATGRLTALFRKYDSDSSGKITIDEFTSILRAFDPDIPDQAVVTVMRAFDDSGDGAITIDEFVEVMSRKDDFTAEDFEEQAQESTDYVTLAADMNETEKVEMQSDLVLSLFANDFLSKGSVSKMTGQMSGSARAEGSVLNREDFQRAIQHADRESNSGDSANINLTPAHAKLVVEHFFKDSDEVKYSDFLAEVTRLSVEAGNRGRGGQVGAGTLE